MTNALATIDAPPALQTYVFSTPQSFETAQRIATALSKSTLVPKEYQNNLPNALIALEIAQRTGSSPLLVMQNLYIVHSRPSWSSQFIISAINSCGRFKPLSYDLTGKENTDARTCVAWTVERQHTIPEIAYQRAQEKGITLLKACSELALPVLTSPPIAIDTAKKEGWYGKNGSKWQTMPELMLRYRTATLFGRLYAPEILMGMKTQDEVEDIIDVTPQTESSVLTNLNDAIRASTSKPDAVIVDQAATDSSPPKEAQQEEAKHDLPEFDISQFEADLKTAKGAKAAAEALSAVLKAHPDDERSSVFLASSGRAVADALKATGQALELKKLEGLGIKLAPEDKVKPTKAEEAE